MLERAGNGEKGSITAFYTVLVEGDDMNEPIADAARSILDGHIVLSRKLATAGHFPSIDVLESISRVESAIVAPERRAVAREIRRMMAAYRDAKDLIEIGAYIAGTNPVVDRSVVLKPMIDNFLRQSIEESARLDDSWNALTGILAPQPGAVQAPA
jgi:flagellum-specific ATP synthase